MFPKTKFPKLGMVFNIIILAFLLCFSGQAQPTPSPTVTPVPVEPVEKGAKCHLRLWSLVGSYENRLRVDVSPTQSKDKPLIFARGVRAGLFGSYRDFEPGKHGFVVRPYLESNGEAEEKTEPSVGEMEPFLFEKDKDYTVLLEPSNKGVQFEVFEDGMRKDSSAQLRFLNLASQKVMVGRGVAGKEVLLIPDLPQGISYQSPDGTEKNSLYFISVERPNKAPTRRMFQIDWKKTPAVTAFIYEIANEASLLIAFDGKVLLDEEAEKETPQPILLKLPKKP